MSGTPNRRWTIYYSVFEDTPKNLTDMESLISKFKTLALFKKQGLHQEVADLLRSMTNDEVKGLYRFLNEAYQESTEDANYLTLDDICYFSTIRATIIISDPGDEQESIERDLDDIINTSKQ